MPALTPSSPFRHLSARGEAGAQQTTVELFFDLAYVFAITPPYAATQAHHGAQS